MKKLFSIIILLVGVIIFLNFNPFRKDKATPQQTSEITSAITVSQKISGQADFSAHQIEEGKTALDLLSQTASIVTTGEKENAYVVGINGIKADDTKKEYWSLYVNEKVSQVGAGSYKLKKGDKIEWKIENYK